MKQRVLASIRCRFTQNIGSHRFVKGDLEALESLLTETTAAQIEFEFVPVQPGIRKAGLPAPMGSVLAAANDHLVRSGFRALQVIPLPAAALGWLLFFGFGSGGGDSTKSRSAYVAEWRQRRTAARLLNLVGGFPAPGLG